MISPPITFATACSGIDAPGVAWDPLGWKQLWCSEINENACHVLSWRRPWVPNHGDMLTLARRIRAGEIQAPDVFCAGTPCQSFSVAGLRGGLGDERGQLTLEYVRICDAIDDVRRSAGADPAVFLWENVPGVLSDDTNAFGCLLGGLAGEDEALQPPGGRWTDAGCVYGPKRAIAWRIKDAQYSKLAQRRRRVFVIGCDRQGPDPIAILFEFDRLRRDTPPRREAGQGFAADVAGSLRSCGTGSGRIGDATGQDAIVAVSNPLGCGSGSRGWRDDLDHGAFVPMAVFPSHLAPVNRERDGKGNDSEADKPLVVVGALQANGKAAGSATQQDTVKPWHVAYPIQEPGKRTGKSTTNSTFGIGIGEDNSPMYTLQSGAVYGVATETAVRRLMPVECERLQGFPDDHTLVPIIEHVLKCVSTPAQLARRDYRYAWQERISFMADGNRYMMLGNSMAVKDIQWLGLRIAYAIELFRDRGRK